ncbi:MAG: alpha/beta fold hydrolase [Bacteroidales bacterium]
MGKIFLIALSAFVFMACSLSRPTNDTIYITDQNKERIDSMYNRRLEIWSEPYQIKDIETSYGRTNIIVSGKEGSPALFLIHAMGVTATMWFPNIHELSKSFRVYSINTIGDIGKSEYRLDKLDDYPKNGEQYAHWLSEICDALNLSRVHVVGSSMGGWIAMNFAVYQAQSIDKLVLLGPMGLKANYLRVMGKLFKVLINPSDRNKRALIAFALGENEKVVTEMHEYMFVATNCKPRLSPPKGLTRRELTRVKSNTLLVLGTWDECIGNTDRNENFARKSISDIDVVILPTGHLMNVEQPEIVNALIRKHLNDE